MADSEAVKKAKERLQKKPVFNRVMKKFKEDFWELVKDDITPEEYDEVFDEFSNNIWDDIKDDATKEQLEEFEKNFKEFFEDFSDLLDDSDLDS
jgi:hypothetical protein